MQTLPSRSMLSFPPRYTIPMTKSDPIFENSSSSCEFPSDSYTDIRFPFLATESLPTLNHFLKAVTGDRLHVCSIFNMGAVNCFQSEQLVLRCRS
jgi:hypothetical protein